MTNTDNVLLDVRGLKTYFFLDEGTVKAVDGVDFTIKRGKTLCVVGESGCGKSVTARSIMQIVDPPGKIIEGQMLFYRQRVTTASGGQVDVIDLAKMDPRGKDIRKIRGKEIAMIFQEPMTSLSPVHTIGHQISQAILLHTNATKAEAREKTIEVLRLVGIPRPEIRVDGYPFQLSGGMRQRAMIAMALSCQPSLLIADEPTTALDVTTQAQILDLMLKLQAEMGMAIHFITHDMGVVAEIADDVAVMYLGLIVERGNVDTIFNNPKHPYTEALLRSIPQIGPRVRQRLNTIKGMVPDPYNRPKGCPFNTRCLKRIPGVCNIEVPGKFEVEPGHEVRCVLYSNHQGGSQ
ncbi:MAG TPA: ABC transporter ATP-binding protein [Anaerolineaceae bacterium]